MTSTASMVLLLFLVRSNSATILSGHFHRGDTSATVSPSDLEIVNSQSKAQCASFCLQRPNCKRFSHVKETKKCTLASGTASAGSNAYEKEEAELSDVKFCGGDQRRLFTGYFSKANENLMGLLCFNKQTPKEFQIVSAVGSEGPGVGPWNVPIDCGAGNFDVRVGDVLSDATSDIICWQGGPKSVLMGTIRPDGVPVFVPVPLNIPEWSAYATDDSKFFLQDVNGDKNDDFVYVDNAGEERAYYFLNLVDQTSATVKQVEAGCRANQEVHFGYVNGDTQADMLCRGKTSDTGYTWTAYFGNGDGTLQNVVSLGSDPCQGAKVYFANMNGDEFSDLVCHSGAGVKIRTYVYSGGRWTVSGQYNLAGGYCTGLGQTLHVGDFYGLGRDSLLCHSNSSRVDLLQNLWEFKAPILQRTAQESSVIQKSSGVQFADAPTN